MKDLKFILLLKKDKKLNLNKIIKIIEFDNVLYNKYQHELKPSEIKIIETNSFNIKNFYKINDYIENYDEKTHSKINNLPKKEENDEIKIPKTEENLKSLKEKYTKNIKDNYKKLNNIEKINFKETKINSNQENLIKLMYAKIMDFEELEIKDINRKKIKLNKEDINILIRTIYEKIEIIKNTYEDLIDEIEKDKSKSIEEFIKKFEDKRTYFQNQITETEQ